MKLTDLIEETRDKIVKKAVDRFLGWQLPHDFKPDGGIHYSENVEKTPPPIGTNLFDYMQATHMFLHIIDNDIEQAMTLAYEAAEANLVRSIQSGKCVVTPEGLVCMAEAVSPTTEDLSAPEV